MKKLIEVLKKDGDLKPYRPELRSICGSVTATILLQQIIYWTDRSKGKFYKFKEPNNHELYKEGDSWLEELAFGEKEFTAAIRNIGFKRGKGVKGQVPQSEEEALVVYYTDKDRLTWYILNEDLLEKHLEKVYQVTPKRAVTKETPKRAVTIHTETTTERERLSHSPASQGSLRSQTNKAEVGKEVSDKSKPTSKQKSSGFNKNVEWHRYREALNTPGFIDQFLGYNNKGVWVSRNDVNESAEKCFAWNCEKLRSPNDWKATLYLWIKNERIDDE